jgi:hypothetical protein
MASNASSYFDAIIQSNQQGGITEAVKAGRTALGCIKIGLTLRDLLS